MIFQKKNKSIYQKLLDSIGVFVPLICRIINILFPVIRRIINILFSVIRRIIIILFPVILIIFARRKINMDIKKYTEDKKNKKEQKNIDEYYKKLQDTGISPSILQQISFNIYSEQNYLITNIENKAPIILVATGLVVGTFTIIVEIINLNFNHIQKDPFFRYLIFPTLSLSIISLILSIFCGLFTNIIYQRYSFSEDELLMKLPHNKNRLLLLSSYYLYFKKLNVYTGLMKSNFIYCAQRHLFVGFTMSVIGLFLLIIDNRVYDLTSCINQHFIEINNIFMICIKHLNTFSH